MKTLTHIHNYRERDSRNKYLKLFIFSFFWKGHKLTHTYIHTGIAFESQALSHSISLDNCNDLFCGISWTERVLTQTSEQTLMYIATSPAIWWNQLEKRMFRIVKLIFIDYLSSKATGVKLFIYLRTSMISSLLLTV